MSASEASQAPAPENKEIKKTKKEAPKVFGIDKRLLGVIVCAVVAAVMVLFPIEALGLSNSYIFTSVIVMILALIFEIMPIGLVVMVWCGFLVASNLTDSEVALSGFTDSVTWLIFGAFMLGEAAVISGFARRMAYSMLRIAGTNYKRITLVLYLIGALLGLAIPSGTARMAVVFPIYIGLLEAFNCKEGSNEALDLMLQIKWAFSGGSPSVAWMTGSSTSPIILGVLESQAGITISWLNWAIWMALPTVGIALLLWWTTTLFTGSKVQTVDSIDVIKDELASLGSMSTSEKKAAIWMAIAVVLWATGEITGIGAAWVAMLVGLGVFMPGVGVLTKKHLKNLDWNIILFCGGAISMAGVIDYAGIGEWAVDAFLTPMMSPFQAMGQLGEYVGLWIFGFAMHFIIPSGTATAAAVTPLSLGYAMNAELNPIITSFVINWGNRPFIFPYQVMSVMLVWGYAKPTFGAVARVLGLQSIVWLVWSIASTAYFMLIIPMP